MIPKSEEYDSFRIDIIPEMGYHVLESEVTIYVYDDKTGRSRMIPADAR